MFAPPGSPRTFRTHSPHARQIRYAGSVPAAAASCSVADEDYARAGLGGCGPGRADVGQGEGPEGDLDRAAGDQLEVDRDLGLDVGGGDRAGPAAGDRQLPAPEERGGNDGLGPGQRADLDVLDVGAVLLGPAASEGGEGGLGDGSR